jgi:hypothetical protein
MTLDPTTPADSKLLKLLSRCKCGVFLTVNEHRDYYQTARECLDKIREYDEATIDELPVETFDKMVETNTIVCLQFYPDTPIGSYTIYHHDVEAALDQALSVFSR